MRDDLTPMMKYISEIMDSSKSVNSSKVATLSNLNNEEINFLSEIWSNAELERRREIISQLFHLSEVDLKLDFSRIFAVALGDVDEKIRIQAACGLEAEDNYLLIKPLLKALKEDTSTEVRAAVAVTLGKFALQAELGNIPSYYQENLYNSLLDILDDDTEPVEVRRRSLEAISPFNSPGVRELIQAAYRSDDVKFKASAVYAMGRNCDSGWLPSVLAELKSNEAEIRYEAAGACGELGAEEAVPYLAQTVADSDERVKQAAIKAIGEIGNHTAKQVLTNLAKNPEPVIREAAEAALKEIQFCEDPLSLQH